MGNRLLWNIRNFMQNIQNAGDRGSTVFKVLCYKSEDRWFDPRWCQWIFHGHKIPPIALWTWGRINLLQKWVPGVFPGGKGGRSVRMTTYHHPMPLSRNLGTLTSWNPLGLSRPVMGLVYLYIQTAYHAWFHVYAAKWMRSTLFWNQIPFITITSIKDSRWLMLVMNTKCFLRVENRLLSMIYIYLII